MPNTPPITIDDIRDIFPGEDDEALQVRIDGVWGRIRLLVPCYVSPDFEDWKVAYVKSVVLEALKYKAQVAANGGAKKQMNTGPFGVTMETREQAPSTLFTKPQEESLRALCGVAGATSGGYSVKLGAPDYAGGPQ